MVEQEPQQREPSEFDRRVARINYLILEGHKSTWPDAIVLRNTLDAFFKVAAEMGFLVGSFPEDVLERIQLATLAEVLKNHFIVWDSELDDYRVMTDDEMDPDILAAVNQMESDIKNMD